jgi:hypothetical protein
MSDSLKCFISAPHEVDTNPIKNALALYGVESFDVYDFSIGDSIQQILKRKIRQSDFALFVLANNNLNVLYEMGVCEGIGKQYFVFIEKGSKLPFFLTNKFFLIEKIEDAIFLKTSIESIIQDVAVNKKNKLKNSKHNNIIVKKYEAKSYSLLIKNQLAYCLKEAVDSRDNGRPEGIEQLVSRVFSVIQSNFVENTKVGDDGVDFVLWNDNLAKMLSSQILVQVKYGRIRRDIVDSAAHQMMTYAMNADVGVGIFLYLDRDGQRFKAQSSLRPLIIAYDIEDFIEDLIKQPLEQIILAYRNNIAHNIS